MTYIVCYRSRYGFIITDAYLVAFRLTRRALYSGRSTGQQSGRSRALNYRLSGESTITAATDSTFYDDRPET